MPPSTRMPFGAIFDVKPVDDSGSLDFDKINSVQPTVNLSSFRPKKLIRNQKPASVSAQKSYSAVLPQAQELPPVIGLPSKQDIKDQFDELMSHDLDLGVELAKVSMGGKGIETSRAIRLSRPRFKIAQSNIPELAKPEEEDLYAPIISSIHHSATIISREEYEKPVEPVAEEVSIYQENNLPAELSESAELDVRALFYSPAPAVSVLPVMSTAPKMDFKTRVISTPKIKKTFKWPKIVIPKRYLLLIGAIIIASGIVTRYALGIKKQIVQQSSEAVANLQTAQEDLKALDFGNASQDFFSAYANFSKAGDSLNLFGAGITNIIASLPGGSSLKSAKNLVQVGQLLSSVGTSMTSALNAVSKTGALSNPTNPQLPVGPIVGALKKALLASKQQVAQASSLMADIDSSIIPADKQDGFNDLKIKLPEIERGVNMSADYAKFFDNLINSPGYHRYLVMFQNGSELRPTGGFPGTYGVVGFKDGLLDSFFVDDVYNIDGQLKENIIPPIQMQHITPNWGMRDANWYVDFSASAKNIEKFYKKEADLKIDGVIVVNPEMIAKILDIVGPVEMTQYNLTLNAKNVLTTIQSQVEYGANRVQPKQIVKDFAPLLLSKIYSAGSDKWIQIFDTVIQSMNQKNVLMSFNDLSLESFVTDKGFGGQVHQGDADYLMATLTNIKGSKTDAVTDTSMTVDTTFDNTTAIHTLTITRKHNGGGEKYGFYNKQNPSYARVLVPDGSELISVSGNDQPNFKPLINYAGSNFVRDETLVKFEASGKTDPVTGVTTYHESGKTEFGFWLITDPGKTKTVSIQYRVPKALTGKTYQLYIQKQPALKVKSFTFSMQKPEGLTPDASAPLLTQKDSSYSYSAPLENDLTVKVNFK
ncbi:MAG: DUF4012 domain-containing protein [Candidatus Pacebacteria bacterium]|nr:DUF4012 domain-containing protein [Candidatus Paceibacterota bacterium]